MADYYPLIARAIAALDPNAPGESRRALYERARTALIAQLRSVQPPLSESEITRERLSLEEAVRKVESEAAQRAREASRPGGGARPSGSGDAFRRASTRAAEGNPAAAPPAGPPRTRPAPQPPRADRPSFNVDDQGDAQRPPRAPRFDAPRQPGPSAPPMPEPPAPPPAGRDRAGPRRPADAGPPSALPPAPGVRGFRDITADANDLGGAAAQANRAARRTYANVPSPSPEFDRLEPSMENRAAGADAPYSYDESIEEAERYAPPSQPPSQRPHIPVLDREPN